MTEKKLPTELLLIKMGKTVAQQGTFELTPEVAQSNSGQSVPIDPRDFSGLYGAIVGCPAGWARTEAREDGLWLTEISWSKEAQELFQTDSTPQYVVPAFENDEGGKITRVISASLTNQPSDTKATRLK